MNDHGGDRETRVALFQKREIRRTIHNNAWWFVITDIIAALTDAIDPSDYWKKMRKRDPDLGKVLQGGGQFVPPLERRCPGRGRACASSSNSQTGRQHPSTRQ